MEQNDLIQKWLNDELSPDERAAWEALEDRHYFEQLIGDAQHFKAAHQSTPADFQSLKDRLPNAEQPVKKERYWLRIAAVLVIGLALWFGLTDRSGVVLDAPVGAMIVHQLPDRSEVRLNAGSRLAYNEKNWSDDRSLQLQGEAYFDVEKGATFEVETTLGTVRVLGTEFNVRQRQGLFQVRCYEGKVAVNAQGQEYVLTPGMGVRIMGEEVSLIEHQVDRPAWLGAQSYFEALPFRYVVEELERQFDVEVQVPEAKQEELFTGGFDHGDLDAALRAIATPMELEFVRNSDTDITLSQRAP